MQVPDHDTPRPALRDWRGLDGAAQAKATAALARLLTPKVTAPLPPSLRFAGGAAEAAAWMAARAAEARVLLAADRDGTVLGLLLLAPDEGAEGGAVLHLGYLLAEAAWGRGLAREMVQGLVLALAPGPAARLLGGVGRDNPASARVLRKCGFAEDAGLSDADTAIFARSVGGGGEGGA